MPPNMWKVFRTIKRDMWLVENYDWLKKHYEGMHVAYCNGGLLLAEKSFDALAVLVEKEGYHLDSVGLIYVDPELTRKQISHGRFS